MFLKTLRLLQNLVYSIGKLALLLLLTLSVVQAQSKVADSLHKVLKNYPKRDTQYVNLLNQAGSAYYTSIPKKTQEFGQKALKFAKELNFYRGIADSYNTLGISQLVKGNYPKATEYYKQSLKMYLKLKNGRRVASIRFNLAVVAGSQAQYDIAIDYYLKSIKYFKSSGNTTALASCYNNLGVNYKKREEYEEAAKYYRLALEGHLKTKYQPGISSGYTNLGRISQVMKKYPEALDYYNKSLAIGLKIGNKTGQSVCYHNIGEVKATLGKHKEAIEYYKKSYFIEQELGNPNSQAITCNFLSESYRALKNYDQAREYLLQARDLAQKTGSRNVLKNNFLFQARLDSTQGKHLEALTYYQKYTMLKDSIFNQTKSAQIAQMKARFETEQKEKEILKLEKQQQAQENTIHRQNLIIIIAGLSLLLALFLVFVIYRFYNIKKKSNEQLVQLNNELYQQQDEITTQRDFIEDQRQRLEKQHFNITQSLKAANHLQQATFPHPTDIAKLIPEYFILFKPKHIVSGDFYWVEKVGNQTFVVVGDGTGHGVIGGFMAMLATALLDRIIKNLRVTEPMSILTMMNQEVRNILHQQENNNQNGMDLGMCVFEETTDSENMQLTFAGARRPLWYAYPGIEKIEEVAATRKAIGGFLKRNKDFTQHTITVPRDTTFYLFSDGYTDQNDAKRAKLSQGRFREIICDIHLLPLDKQQEQLESILAKHMEGTEQRDDIAIMGWKMH
ncbi:hypothetical protein BKI52_01760 [marine bacterium AO1-C]|nr:hypothetical protein BKI52_01760 [marine bacterium AO1-C]